MYICRKCGRGFGAERVYVGHLSQCSKKKVACPICGRKLLQSVYSLHMRAHKRDKDCPVCGKRIFRRTKFCSIGCGNAYNAKRARKKNLGGNIRKEIIKIGLTTKEIQVRYCLYCGKTLGLKGRLYCSIECQKAREWKEMKKAILKSGDAGNTNSHSVKKILIEERKHRCEICGSKTWRSNLVPLIMDHIDGNAENNLLKNLRLVCCNCNAQLPTYAGRNRGNGRLLRRMWYRSLPQMP